VSFRPGATLAIMIITCSPKRTLTGAPAELSITR
jgi:general nucleoside transport system permease protein